MTHRLLLLGYRWVYGGSYLYGSAFTLRADNYTIEGTISGESEVELLSFPDDVTTSASKAVCPATPDATLYSCVSSRLQALRRLADQRLRLPACSAGMCRCCGVKSTAP